MAANNQNASIGLHLIALNEGGNILSVLGQVVDICAEMLVLVDDRSTDRTVDILRAWNRGKLRFWVEPFHWDFSEFRNRLLERARTEWILQLDADERLSYPLYCWLREIDLRSVPYSSCDGVEMRRENLIDGQPIGHKTYEWHTRLFRSHLRFVGKIHEYVPCRTTIRAPAECFILHHKTGERQGEENRRYAEFARRVTNAC